MDFFESFLVWLHVLLFVYWLGGDLGVFYSSKFRNSSKYEPKTRALIGKITANVDMAPRTTMVLMIPIGFSLVALRGLWEISNYYIIIFWAFGIMWLFLVWWLHLNHDHKKKQLWIKIDYFIRWFLLIVLSLSAVSSFIFLTPFNQGWLAIKVLLFAGTIFCGIMIRISAKPYIKAFQKMLSEGSSPKLEKEINDSASTARIWVKMIWLLISIAAFIGIWQPTIF